MTEYVAIAVFFAITFIAAMSGGYFRPGEFYDSLAKPSWNPPDWLFPPAWFVLYVFIATAGWLVWDAAGVSTALIVWLVQIVLNMLWSYFAFGKHRFDYAFYDVIALWISIAAFITLAWPINQAAALLFVPYILWVSFAGVLNWTVWRMNPIATARS